jgi:hypothetical protein
MHGGECQEKIRYQAKLLFVFNEYHLRKNELPIIRCNKVIEAGNK